MHGIFWEYYFDLVVAMLLFGLLGVMFVADEYHVSIGVLVVDIIIVFMMISGIIFWSITLMSCCLWIISG